MLVKHRYLARCLTTLTMPWNFEPSDNPNLSSIPMTLRLYLKQYESGFIQSYSTLLDSISTFDIEYIKELCDENLFKTLELSLAEIKSKNYKILVANSEEVPKIRFFNEKFIFSKPFKSKSDDPDIIKVEQIDFHPHSLISSGNMFFEFEKALKYKISVDVLYKSAKKLIVLDQDNNIIEGDPSKTIENHLFTFQLTVNTNVNFLSIINHLSLLYNILNGNPYFSQGEWTVTNIDNYP